MTAKLLNTEPFENTAIVGTRVGIIVSVQKPNTIFVEFEGNPFGPMAAMSTVPIPVEAENRQVVLIFKNNSLKHPIIIGVLQDSVTGDDVAGSSVLSHHNSVEIHVDGEKLIVDAKREVELRCGKSSLLMKPDGKIIIKGDNIVSRARCTNKIKGAAVRIN